MQTNSAPGLAGTHCDDPHLLALPWASAGRMRLRWGTVLRFQPDPQALGLQVAVFEWQMDDGAPRRVTLGVHLRHVDDWLQDDDDALLLVDHARHPGHALTRAGTPGDVCERVRLTSDGGFAYRPTPGFVGREVFAYLTSGLGQTLVAHVTLSLRPTLN